MSHRYDPDIVAAMTELSKHAEGPTPIEQALFELTTAAVTLVDGVDCADVLIIKGDEFQSRAATSPVATTVDQAQKDTGQGPCLDAAERDVIVRCNDLRNEQRWPAFTGRAMQAGVLSVMSFRLYHRDGDSGALNLFGFGTGSFTAEPEAVGVMLATHAAMTMIAADRQHQFDSALASRDVIGQAKGIIMERFDVDALHAFALLKQLSQDTNTPLKTIADRLTRREKH